MRLPLTLLFVLLVFGAISVPVFALAHPDTPQLFPTGFWGPIVSCGYEGVGPCVSVCDLIHTTQHFIYLGLTILVFLLAPIAVIGGAFMIMLSGGSEEKVKKGRTIIMNAVIGLAIGLGAFLIINTLLWMMGALGEKDSISWPNIQCDRDNLAPAGTGAPTPPTAGTPTSTRARNAWPPLPLPAGTYTDAEARSRLDAENIIVNKANCTVRNQSNCTSLDGIPKGAIARTILLKRNCERSNSPCHVNITGGTEDGHATHGIGRSIFDLSLTKGVNEYVHNQIGDENPCVNLYFSEGNFRGCVDPQNQSRIISSSFKCYAGRDSNEYCLENDHWHVRVNI